MASFKIVGGQKLSGTVIPQGAKNEALQVICATLLSKEKIIIQNIPNIIDIRCLIKLLEGLGVIIHSINRTTYSFEAKNIKLDYLKSVDFQKNSQKIRGSVMLIGPLIARFGKAILYPPGGDKIGRRRLDTHLVGLSQLGAKFKLINKKYYKIVIRR